MATQKGRNWSSGDIVTAANLSSIERGVSAVAEEYTPTTWANGNTVTAAALNNIEQGIVNAGGSSDFSTAKVTVTSTLMVPVTIQCAAVIEDIGTGGLVPVFPGASSNATIILFNGEGRITTGAGATITSSEGDITVDEGGGAGTVTGDCAITISSGDSSDISE